MEKETKGESGSNLSSYNKKINCEKVNELYRHSDNSYREKIIKEIIVSESTSSKEKAFNEVEIDEKYSKNTPVRIKIRVRIIND
jgi:hypothetical protein